MSFDPVALLPAIDPSIAIGLVVLSFLTSAITAAFSLGGGMLLLSVMVMVLPAAVIVPVHGLVQLGSNAGRAVVQRRHANWTIAIPMIAGAIPGALAGGQVVQLLPGPAFAFVIGLFVLVTTWIRLPKQTVRNPVVLGLVGAAIGAVGMVIGATGPLTSLFLSRNPDRRVLVATHAAIMTAQHLSKIAVYVMLGFALGPWLALVLAMIAAGFAGTVVGSHLLERLPEKLFRVGLKALLTVIALDLLRRGIFG